MALIDVVRWVVGLIISLGVANAVSRFYYEYQDEKKRNLVISSAYWIAFAVLIIFSPFIHLLSPFLSKIVFHVETYSEIFSVSLLALLFSMIADLGIDYLRIKTESVKVIKISLVRMVFVISCNIFFIVHLETGVIGIFYANLLASIIFACFLSFIVLKKTKLGFSLKISLNMIHYSFPLIFSSIFRGIINESDKLFINYFFSPVETGIYSIAQKFGTSIHSLITSPFLQTYLPRRFQIMKNKNVKDEYAMILEYYLIAICSAGLFVAIFSREVIQIMTTQNFYAATVYIPPIVLSMIIFGMKYHFEIGILIKKKTKYIFYINGLSCGINIVLNWMLIKKFGILGAVLAINISYLATTLLNLFVSQKLYHINFNYFKTFQIILLAVSVYGLSVFVTDKSLLIAIAVKVLIYGFYIGILFAGKIIHIDITRKLKGILVGN